MVLQILEGKSKLTSPAIDLEQISLMKRRGLWIFLQLFILLFSRFDEMHSILYLDTVI